MSPTINLPQYEDLRGVHRVIPDADEAGMTEMTEKSNFVCFCRSGMST